MQKLIVILILFLSFSSCKSSKRAKNKRQKTTKIITKKSNVIEEETSISNNKTIPSKKIITKPESIIKYAKQFEGVRYKWGGTSKSGMDCSGLIFESFREHDIILPRISRDMAKKGKKVILKNVVKGDLLFFKTGNRRNAINHVGLIVDIRDNNIEFIHATSGKGVITSWLNEAYWLKAFYEARRIL
ncbi:C40 family peptidase [Algibacter aquimarinus]|uniref:NlpC/P60 domain-containing protein n=1 Tax=Algibacter aquimarinus TaxID=1136748 RepID=A0ABP9HSW9_9FLAO